jgi:hypothetical protein
MEQASIKFGQQLFGSVFWHIPLPIFTGRRGEGPTTG